jgi:hypothetical protein
VSRSRRSYPPEAAAALVAAALCGLAACDRDKDRIASLVEVLSGSVEKSSGEAAWGPAARGDTFKVGDAVKTSADGGARLEFRAGSGLKMGPSTVIRFGRRALGLVGEVEAEEGANLDILFGDAELATRISRGGRIKMIEDEEGNLRFDVLVGSATITREDGESFTVGQGESFEFDLELEPTELKSPDPPDAGPPPDAEVEEPAAAPAAILAVVRGRGARIRDRDDARWRRLPEGEHELAAGTGVNLRGKTRVELSRGDEKATVSGNAEFVAGSAGGPLMLAQSGSATVHATTVDVTVQVAGGTITARRSKGAGSRADVDVSKARSRVRGRAGRVDVEGGRGGKETLQIGEWVELGRDGSLTLHDRPPATSHFSIPAGESPFIHDPGAPTNVRIRFQEKCPSDGIVELGTGRGFQQSARIVRGSGGGANVRVTPGSYRYRVRCIVDGAVRDAVVASGNLRLNRAAGTKSLPPRPAENIVDADGRPYTVLYQNLLPHITFRWQSAPKDGSYRLHVVPTRGRAEVVTAKQNRARMTSGSLPEGEYDYWFVDSQGKQSRKSRLRIAFDNAADTGYVRSPRVRESWSSSVRVEGAAIRGWSVSIGSVQLPLDGQFRFKTTYSVPQGQSAIAIRFSHPQRGVHYYVRRNGGN